MWQIKQAQENDIEAISTIIKEVAPLAFTGIGTKEQLDKWIEYHSSHRTILENLESGTNTLLVIDEQGHIVATAYLRISKQVGYVGGLYCLLQNEGLGPLLIRTFARNLNISQLTLDVYAKNERMLHVVKKLGFIQTGQYYDKTFFQAGLFVTFKADLPLP